MIPLKDNRLLGIMAIIGILCVISGCATLSGFRSKKTNLTFHCEENINEGLLLPIDVIVVNKGEEKGIIQIGPDAWFESEYRNNLTRNQLTKLALRGNETRKVAVDILQKESVVIIFADYKDLTDKEAQQIVIYPQGWRWQIKGDIMVGEKGLQIVE